MRDSIQPFINKRMLVLNQNTPAKEAARALHERHVGSAVVSDHGGHIVGIVTDRDLSSQILGFGMSSSTPISEIMTDDILSVGRSASVTDVAKIMETNGIRRIPVLEKTETGRDKCIGLVSLDDLIASESVDIKTLSRIVRSQILRRVQSVHPPYKDDGHREQTYNRFINVLAGKMNVPKASAGGIAFYLLKSLVRRLSYTDAAHFIAQLPSLIHEDLLSLPAGPDLEINEESIIQDLMEDHQLTQTAALDLTKNFWAGMEEVMSPAILNRVLERLPVEMRGIFSDTDMINVENFFYEQKEM